MDHASPKRFDLLERGIHVSDREVGQGSRIARAGTTFVDAERRSTALGLPAAAFGVAAPRELDSEQARPEPTRAVGIISGELDQAERSVHVPDDNDALTE
jgi:hypothetical protein